MTAVSCVIPAYNEDLTIRAVLEVVTSCPLITEVIVVNDCSQDSTSEVVSSFGSVRLLTNEVNKGKSYSVARGIQEAKGDIIILIDADLTGLSHHHIKNLLSPVLSEEVHMTIGSKDVMWISKIIGLDYIAGERVFKKSLITQYSTMESLESFGLEPFLNELIIKNRWKIRVIKLDGVGHVMKTKKTSLYQGIKDSVLAARQIIGYTGVVGAIQQNIKLVQLKA